MSIKIACISDTHTQHRDIEIPECDLLVVTGDLTYRGELSVLRDFNTWCGELKEQGTVKEVVVISGNHDLTTDPIKPEYYSAFRDLFTNCVYLQHEVVEVMGLRIWGSPASPFFCNWGHNFHRGEDIQKIWDLMLADHEKGQLDIILTHGPVYKILDWVVREDWTFDPAVGSRLKKTKDYVGCKDLLKAVEKIQPALHVSGHIHCAAGHKEKNGTLFVNASTCTEEYKPHNPPIVVELEKVDGKWKAKVSK
jgi:Icc-related predicted phosphoesterase